MSKVIIFSRQFPSYHPKAGQPTFFVEKFYNSFYVDALSTRFFEEKEEELWNVNRHKGYLPYDVYMDFRESLLKSRTQQFEPKHHTIRAGHRFKAGEYFSPRVWSGKPYRSKQILIAPDVKIEKVFDFEMKWDAPWWAMRVNDEMLVHHEEITLAKNDGLDHADLVGWFNEPFQGQIICWNKEINY